MCEEFVAFSLAEVKEKASLPCTVPWWKGERPLDI